jgi:energy-coupling factor transport system ATP-binding protein
MPEGTGSLIDVAGASYVYPAGKVTALSETSLRIGRGEMLGIIGQNGSGKTTLTKLLNGLLRPMTGHVEVCGVRTGARKVQELAAHVGYVFQNPNHQLFARTIEAELRFGPVNLGCSAEEVDERVASVAEVFGLGPYLDLAPYRVSFPLRKLVAIASVVTMRTPVLILDEPTTGQDHRTVTIINEVLRGLHAAGTTVICVSHDMPLLAEVVDRVVVMHRSNVIADAPPREIFSAPDVMAATNLHPPQATELSMRTVVPAGGPVALTPTELVGQIAARTRLSSGTSRTSGTRE